MRRFVKKAARSAAPTTTSAEEEAEAELRRAAEALGMPGAAPAVRPPPAPAAPQDGVVAGATPAAHEVDPHEEDVDGPAPGQEPLFPDDVLPEEALAPRPAGAAQARRRVRKTPPGAADPVRRATGGTRPRSGATGRSGGAGRS
ncbi:MAG TPA: hypothetical protein VHM89_11205 [Acidimicrobiales bacterium]|nr:hypothetical protein [Acidimicrobiales bacterium]